MAGKFYAVKVGREPGIYNSWDDCKKMVDGFKNASYKSFKTKEEAEAFIENGKADIEAQETILDDYAFVDGSFNVATGVYGYGGFLISCGKEYILQGCGNDEENASMRNVAGEIGGSMAAVEKAIELGIKELTILYDYLGIEKWATGEWKANKAGTIAYANYMKSVSDKIVIRFRKVEAHTGIVGNERADQLAKEIVGLV